MPEQKIYISDSGQETAVVDRLKRALTAAGYVIAPNIHTIPPGVEVKKAIAASLAGAARFLACFSSSHGAPVTYEPLEVAMALDRSITLPQDVPWLIPVKLNPCAIPPLAAGDAQLSELAAIDLSTNFERAVDRLLASLPAPVTEKASTSPGLSELDADITALRGRHARIANVDGAGSTSGDAKTKLRIGSVTVDDTFTISNRTGKP